MDSDKRQKIASRVAVQYRMKEAARTLNYDPVVILAHVVGRIAQASGFPRERAYKWLREALALSWSSGREVDFKALKRAIERPYRSNRDDL